MSGAFDSFYNVDEFELLLCAPGPLSCGGTRDARHLFVSKRNILETLRRWLRIIGETWELRDCFRSMCNQHRKSLNILGDR